MLIAHVHGTVDHDMYGGKHIGLVTFDLHLSDRDYGGDALKGGVFDRAKIIDEVRNRGEAGTPIVGEWHWDAASLSIQDNVTVERHPRQRNRIMPTRRDVRAQLVVPCW